MPSSAKYKINEQQPGGKGDLPPGVQPLPPNEHGLVHEAGLGADYQPGRAAAAVPAAAAGRGVARHEES